MAFPGDKWHSRAGQSLFPISLPMQAGMLLLLLLSQPMDPVGSRRISWLPNSFFPPGPHLAAPRLPQEQHWDVPGLIPNSLASAPG